MGTALAVGVIGIVYLVSRLAVKLLKSALTLANCELVPRSGRHIGYEHREVIGYINQPDTGLLFTLQVDQVEGFGTRLQ